jgi:uncharacterized membrane protein
MKFDWKKTIKAVAPMIGTAIGGPFGGLATSAISAVLGTPENATDKQMAEAVKNATPDQLLALKEADNNFLVKMKELGIKEEDLHAKDRDSARRREIALGGDTTMKILAVATIVGFFAFIGFLLVKGTPTGMDKTLLGMIIGYVVGLVQQVYNYYFGSSKGSKDKTILSSSLK